MADDTCLISEFDFTRPDVADFDDWEDMQHDYYFGLMVDAVLACYVEGDSEATDKKIEALSSSGTYSMGDINNVFEYFSSVAEDDHITDPDLMLFKGKVIAMLNLFRRSE